MSRTAGKAKTDPAREALANAPLGPPLTDEERARVAAARRPGAGSVSQEELLAELEERIRRGE